MKSLVVVMIGGMIFGLGLAASGLAKQEVVLSFLYLEDLGLALTMGVALAVGIPVYQLAPRFLARPPAAARFERFPRAVTRRHVGGGTLFGVGWGLCGVCPGSAVASVGLGNWPIFFAIAGMLIGAYVQGAFLAPSPRASPA